MLPKIRTLSKLQKKFIGKFLNIIEHNSDYIKFFEENNLTNNEVSAISKIKFYDLFDNSQLNKLIRRIGGLNKAEYDVDLAMNFRKTRELNYLSMQYDYTSRSFIGKVFIKDDLFVDKIEIAFTQINNNEVVVEFNFSFKEIMTHGLWIEFLKDNKDLLLGKRFFDYYDIERNVELNQFDSIHNSFTKVRNSTLQAKLSNIFHLNLGKTYSLPQYNLINIPEEYLNECEFIDTFLTQTIAVEQGNYILVDLTSAQGFEMNLYYSWNYPSINLLELFATYRMDFYYFLFENIERFEIRRRINKYFLNTSKRIALRDYRWLINKIRSLKDNTLFKEQYETNKLIDGWTSYYHGQEVPLGFEDGQFTKKYSVIYSECFDHIKMAYSIQKENLVIYIATGSFVAALAGVIITIALS
ncbi:hypothetical protein QL818_09455 [Bacillus altitudinis]|uniref:hypothetical protein n=1 Tax=Bacillus altitudinis TaxID=293387 RepID=UPI0024A9CB5D|nr:hypothetical protein [Bacillus altitudinis]MDI6647287.1 hypothetical protein [Bacillus altitudinis]MDI6661909.1 hypothetical protein [Bacillus altitudinis]